MQETAFAGLLFLLFSVVIDPEPLTPPQTEQFVQIITSLRTAAPNS